MSEVETKDIKPTHAKPNNSGGGIGGGGRGGRGRNSRPNSRPSSRNDNRREPNPNPNNNKGGGNERRGSQDVGRGGRRLSNTRPRKSVQGAQADRKSSDASGTVGEDRIRQVIGELKAMPPPSGSALEASPEQPTNKRLAGPPPSSSAGHRKSGSTGGGVKSTLNPNAGGFQPGALSSISDVDAEVLITPAPDQTHFPIDNQDISHGAYPGSFVTAEELAALSSAGIANPGAGLQFSNQNPGLAGAFGLGAGLGLSDLQASVQARALQVANMQAALALSQQTAQLPPRFGGNPLAGVDMGALSMGGIGAEHLMSPTTESFHIQQQLQLLAQHQEALLSRIGDLQSAVSDHANNAATVGRTVTSPITHRRGQSAQIGGAGAGGGLMGNFAVDGSAGVDLPKGHGRRHSIQVGQRSNNATIGGAATLNLPATATSAPLNSGFNNLGGAPVGELEMYNRGGTTQTPVRGHRRNQSSFSGSGGFAMDLRSNQGLVQLNQAQVELMQLAQFRDAPGHARLPSFAYRNPMNFGPGQVNLGSANQRKTLFAPYLAQASIPPLLNAGKLVIGKLRVNKRNRSDAYVTTDALDSDIYICGSKDRNRALEGDVVAVELLDVDDVWGTKKEKEEKKRKKEENQSFNPTAQQNMRREDKKRDDIEVEGQGLLLFEEEEVNDDQRPSYAGHIVAVVERMPGQLFSGTLALLRPSSAATKEKQEAERREREGVDLRGGQQREEQKPKIVWHRPTDKRVPLIAIPVDQAPANFLKEPEMYANTLFIASIKRWPFTSLHPFGGLVEGIGAIGDIGVETIALLRDCNFSSETFSNNVTRCLPPVPFSIPDHEYKDRSDFREETVFTIDPEGAKDLDDALHIRQKPDGTFEVGIHIADVTYFVKQESPLDRDAAKRATSVYLVQRSVPMLPAALSEELCSLTPGEDKLTFSVVFTMTPEGRIKKTWYGKSVIRSAAQLSYAQALQVLVGNAVPDVKVHKSNIGLDDIKTSLLNLNKLARQLRQRRFHDGCLRIDNVKLKFALDEDGLPDDCRVQERSEATELVEEFMLLANTAVAQKIASGLPDRALLRKHQPPVERRLEAFAKRTHRLGLDIDISSSGALMSSLNRLETDGKASRFVAQLLGIKTMSTAKYFCAGDLDIKEWHHYALNSPMYTHFTSPIRRYADMVVHRQLATVLTYGKDAPKHCMQTDLVIEAAQQGNIKREAAHRAQEQSQHLFLCALISELTQKYGPVVRPATVMGVLDEAFDVAVPDFGIEKRVHVDQMPIDNYVFDEHADTLKLYWKNGVDVVSYLSEHSSDAHLHSVRQYAERHARLMEASSQSVQAESALFEDDDDDNVVHPRHSNTGQPTEQERKSAQRIKSIEAAKPVFESIARIEAGPNIVHHVQTIKALQTVPVIITADRTKSPPIIKIFAVNPFA